MPDTQLVLYTANYCPYCKDFKPTWEQFKKEAKEYLTKTNSPVQIKTIEITAGNNRKRAINKGVNGFPTVQKEHKDGKIVKFNGNRDVKSLMTFLKK